MLARYCALPAVAPRSVRSLLYEVGCIATARRMRALIDRRAALLFAGVYLAHATMPVSVQGDSRWTVPTALSLIHGNGGDLHEYSSAIAANQFYEIECVQPDYSRRYPIHSLEECRGRLYSFYPIAVPVVAAPFVAALGPMLQVVRPVTAPLTARFRHPWVLAFFSGNLAGATAIVENLLASFFTAGAVAVLYLTAIRFLPSAAGLALLFGFGTLLWSLVSRSLWAHGPSIFFNSLVLLLLLRGKYSRLAIAAIGFLLAINFFVRQTNAVPVLVIGIFLLFRLRARALWAIAGGLPPTALFVLLNLRMYGGPLSPVFFPVREGSTSLSLHPAVATGVLGNLVSPARGLFVFMPFFLFLLIPQVWREPVPALRPLRPWLCWIIAIHMVLVATHTDWWGGFSYGPRYLSDILPYLMLLWSPVLLWMGQNRLRRALVTASVALAVFIQFRGATSIQVHQWNATPISVNDDRSRIWNWGDPPFLRGLR